ncbi:MAG: DNA-3-methyladenine glycosylase [bacterium]
MDFEIDYNKVLAQDFYLQDTELVARKLIGKVLVREIEGNILCGEIVETEAYIPFGDAANHSARGKTIRNAAMHEDGGILYVYKIYGVHHCINVVTEESGLGSAVLIRAIRPIKGIEYMQAQRGNSELIALCNGPGKLALAFSFNKDDNYADITQPKLFIQTNKDYSNDDIINTTRIGIKIAAELNLRYYLKGCKYVSRYKK